MVLRRGVMMAVKPQTTKPQTGDEVSKPLTLHHSSPTPTPTPHPHPSHPSLFNRIAAARRLRRDRFPTMPSTIGDEVASNPYMRIVTSRTACGKIAMAMYGITGSSSCFY
jgi:hypothetical protein